MKLSLREYVFVAMLLSMPVIMWYMVFRPQNQATDLMVQDIQHKSATLARMEDTQRAAVQHVKDDITLLEQALERMNKRLPDAEQTGSVMHELSLLAATNGLNTRAIEPFSNRTPLTEAVNTRFGAQWIRLELEGDFLGFYAFLQDLENQPTRIIRVHTMTLTRSTTSRTQEKTEGRIRATLELVTFYRMPVEKPNSPEKDQADDSPLAATTEPTA